MFLVATSKKLDLMENGLDIPGQESISLYLRDERSPRLLKYIKPRIPNEKKPKKSTAVMSYDHLFISNEI